MNKLRLKIGGVPEHYNYPWRVAIEEGLFNKEKAYIFSLGLTFLRLILNLKEN